ncbi:hypothetical protein SAMN05444483_10151 [Salegentibacter echinorum]|uniref:Uncharacterized protein n=2 Tax=Salegentibacter echinorum TaxID=1073325 RepID=A0A1M5BIR6_SALEC|nr:hypothetical protein SAMN05444483_10151 [Salegentibacter echinorum]
MSVLVFFITTSFSINMHFCGETLAEFSFGHSAEACSMENEHSDLECEFDMNKDNCCSDAQIANDGQDDLKTSYTNLSFEQQIFVATFLYSYINLFDGLDKNIVPFRDYTPPFLIRDFQKIHETYLI